MLDNGRRITLDGSTLRTTDIAALAERTAHPTGPDPKAFARAGESWETARRLAATGRVYGRSTGVGANRTQDVGAADADHGLRLLRSHAGAIGDPLPGREVRAMLAVRANQLLAGGAGLNPAVITSLLAALDAACPPRRQRTRRRRHRRPGRARPDRPRAGRMNTPGTASPAAGPPPPSPSTTTTPSP